MFQSNWMQESSALGDVPEGLIFPDLGVPVLWVSTSGTTAAPKWVALSKSGLQTSVYQVQSFLRDYLKLSDSDYLKLCWGLAITPTKIGGYSVVLRANLWGQRLALWGKPWSPKGFVDWCEQSEINLISLVPTQIFDLVSQRLQCPKTLRVVLVGGDRLNKELHTRALELGWPLICTYAMTELSSTIAVQVSLEEGFEILPHIEVAQIQDQRLAFKSEALFLGYLQMNSVAKDPALSGLFAGQSLELSDESKRKPSFILTPKNAQGFWVSEDRGVLLGRKLSLLGRSQDWIKILGVGVSLVQLRQEFETLLLSQVAGLDKAFLSLILQKTYLTHRPCLRKGRQLVLWVEKNLESMVFDSIKLAIQQWNESHEKPEKIEVEALDKIPRGPTGKVLQSL